MPLRHMLSLHGMVPSDLKGPGDNARVLFSLEICPSAAVAEPIVRASFTKKIVVSVRTAVPHPEHSKHIIKG